MSSSLLSGTERGLQPFASVFVQGPADSKEGPPSVEVAPPRLEASLGYQRGIPPQVVHQWLGIATSEWYAHLAPNTGEDFMDLLDPREIVRKFTSTNGAALSGTIASTRLPQIHLQSKSVMCESPRSLRLSETKSSMPYFMDAAVNILANQKLRKPQVEAYLKIQQYFALNPSGEALVVLPTGTGKSGLVSIAPFGVSQGRVLIITPGLVTKQSIRKTQEPLEDNFWVNFDVIFDPDHLPVVSEFYSDISDQHLSESDIIYTNIHKLHAASERGLLSRVRPDFFDMVIVDEAHHAPANSWQAALSYFSAAKKLHLTGTPYRGDGQAVPGEQIHETPLSEAMRDRYIKWLRKETVNAHELYFTLPEKPGVRLTKDDVLALKDKEWIEKSVALAEPCSRDVIRHSIDKLRDLRKESPDVPHKILAVGCSIAHADDLCSWYEQEGLPSVVVHSDMGREQLDAAFHAVETHACQVVVSVNMLMEGYDHRYLSVLALFRPYRSENAFAQVVGRVLRAIPAEEIRAFEIDNNALLIYHQEIGLDEMWAVFQREVERAKRPRTAEIDISDRDYVSRENEYAEIDGESVYVSATESYLADIDFNQMFADAREKVRREAEGKLADIRKSGVELDDATIDLVKEALIKGGTSQAAQSIDSRLIEKRPALARKQMRELLRKKVEDGIASLLSDLDISEKGTELASKFKRIIFNFDVTPPNDGTLVRFVNQKLYKRFGAVGKRDNAVLLQSLQSVDALIEEVRRMLS